MEDTISGVTMFGAETPTKISAPFNASASVPCSFARFVTVSYTHLDVYKRQPVYKAVIVIIIVAIQAPPFKDYMKKMSAKRQLAKGGVA